MIKSSAFKPKSKQEKISILWNIANDARIQCEQLQKEYGTWRDNLCGMCAIASSMIFNECKRQGIRAKFVYADKKYEGHCWIEVQGYIIDVTATQFGKGIDSVIVERKQNITNTVLLQDWYDNPRVVIKKACSIRSINSFVKDWCDTQQPKILKNLDSLV
jgi:hypothetical protein